MSTPRDSIIKWDGRRAFIECQPTKSMGDREIALNLMAQLIMVTDCATFFDGPWKPSDVQVIARSSTPETDKNFYDILYRPQDQTPPKKVVVYFLKLPGKDMKFMGYATEFRLIHEYRAIPLDLTHEFPKWKLEEIA